MKPPPAHAHVNRLIALSLLLLVFSGTLGLGAVWVRQEISQTANRSRALVAKVADIERRIDEVNAEIAAAASPGALMRQNEIMRLGLAMPKEIQVQRVEGSPELRLAAKRNRDIFASGPTGDAVPTFRIVNASATLR
jgi:outer membrane murein-binding lipoprotein Lpp